MASKPEIGWFEGHVACKWLAMTDAFERVRVSFGTSSAALIKRSVAPRMIRHERDAKVKPPMISPSPTLVLTYGSAMQVFSEEK